MLLQLYGKIGLDFGTFDGVVMRMYDLGVLITDCRDQARGAAKRGSLQVNLIQHLHWLYKLNLQALSPIKSL